MRAARALARAVYIKSYELGVLVLPSLQPPALRTLTAASSASAAAAAPASSTLVPLPFSIPPVPYRGADVPWTGGSGGSTEPDRHGRTAGYYWGENAAGASYYGRNATGRVLVEQYSQRQQA